jgi:hypothetical protein
MPRPQKETAEADSNKGPGEKVDLDPAMVNHLSSAIA